MPDESILIPLPRGLFAIIDASDAERVFPYRWSVTRRGYACRSRRKGDGLGPHTILMHRAILSAPLGTQVDHINHILLDNRRENLRLATGTQNQGNRRMSANNRSGFKGVYWSKDRNLWVGQIRVAKKTYWLGYFETAKDAARAYDTAAREAFGEFAFLNDV